MPRTKASAAKATPQSRRRHKHQLSSSVTSTPGSRASKRLKESSKTPTNGKKSKYFEDSESDDDADEDDHGSDYEDPQDDSVTELSSASPTSSEAEDDYDKSEEKQRSKKKVVGKSAASKDAGSPATSPAGEGKELWRPGVTTGLGPGKQVFIEKPKPRGDGGVRYVPSRIHPNTMAFLADLRKNNDREWLKMHDPDYRTSWKDWESFVDSLTQKISEVDETIPELPPKDLVFRIYRDIRFSPDKTAYKTHFSAAWSRTGRKGPFACYYVQIAPGGRSLVGSGLWMPDPEPLALLRQNIDRHPERIRQVLTDAELRKTIFGGIPKDEKKAIKAFVSQNAESALKTKPKVFCIAFPSFFATHWPSTPS
jgi:uncharacterized protein (TIGR02453 family)